jgi:hypothetical protein
LTWRSAVWVSLTILLAAVGVGAQQKKLLAVLEL